MFLPFQSNHLSHWEALLSGDQCTDAFIWLKSHFCVYRSCFIILLKTACASFASVSKCAFVCTSKIFCSNKFSFANKNKYSAGRMHSMKRSLPFSHGMAT